MDRRITGFAIETACMSMPAFTARPFSARLAFVLPAACILLSLCAGAWAHAQGQERLRDWVVTDLGTLGGPETLVRGINARGQVVGQSARPGDFDARHAFLYKEGAMLDLNLGAESSYSVAMGINQAGVIVGYNFVGDTGTVFYPFLYRNGVEYKIDVLGYGLGINDAREAVGTLGTVEGGVAVLFRHGRAISLGTLGGGFSIANAINNTGQLAGAASLAGNTATHAFRYERASMQDLGTLGGAFSWATAINDRGSVVGASTTVENQTHAFLHDGENMHDLGTLGGESRAKGINNRGEIVGISLVTEQGRAFLYRCGTMLDLNTLAAVTQSGWTLTDAAAINDRGQIVANARRSPTSPTRGILLTPPSKPERCHHLEDSGTDAPDPGPNDPL